MPYLQIKLVAHFIHLEVSTFSDYSNRYFYSRLNVVVFYDDGFAKDFGAKAQDEVKKVVAQANKEFGHPSLTPKIQVNLLAIEHAKGKTWTGDDPNPYL